MILLVIIIPLLSVNFNKRHARLMDTLKLQMNEIDRLEAFVDKHHLIGTVTHFTSNHTYVGVESFDNAFDTIAYMAANGDKVMDLKLQRIDGSWINLHYTPTSR